MSLEQFNAHQQDVRNRADSLTKAIFILSGGALSISIGLFINNQEIPQNITSILGYSWWSLTTAIISLTIMLFLVIARDYLFGERWRKELSGLIDNANKNTSVIDFFIWVLALCGLITFISGYVGLTYCAIQLI
ncbi:hypothetical protein [Thiomicrorhabdus sediminis]|uniref:Tripartite ATP-independent transporter, DctQ component n=1 Tax=Thiomicrorhabdus sediminis TaxID=2580412 RepID=A0A4P9K4H7_9GAMM|nr:hypothetical protein [Thiomicrorhabdus sediminis]QCU89310.1 hypothetical protein FE785_01020 [Thiomicrorhabdus sediminis]